MSVFTNLTGGGTSSVASVTTASITPGGNRLILVTVHAYLSAGSVQPATPTVTGNGITYSLVASQDTDNSGTDRGTMFLFRGMASAPTAGGITIDFGATTQTRIQWAVDQSGPDVDTSGTNGSGAIIQSTGVTLGAAGTSASVNFPSAMGAGNVGFSAWGHQVQEGKTPRAGWTELADVTTVSLASVETQYISGTDTAGSASWTTSSRAGGIIAEIKSAIGIRGTTTSGTGDTNVSSKTVPVPTGAAVDDIAIVIVDQWTSATERTATITGFTEIVGAHATRATTGTAGTQTIRMFWKRLTAADTGNYTVTFSGTTWNMAHCVMFSGGLASGDPIEVVNTAGATSGYPTTSFTVATLAGLVNSAVTFNAITTTPPTNFTEQQDTNVLHTNTRILTGTGSVTASGGTSSETDTVVVAMIAVQPASSGTTGTVAVTQAADSSSVSGQLGYSGTSAATDSADTSSATGTVANLVTGTAAASQDSQTSSASGQLGYTGTSSAVQAGNASSATGQLGYSGTSARTQANQTSTATGQLGYSGTSARTEAADTSLASGTFTGTGISGNAAVTQAGNTGAAAGQLGYAGTSARTQAAHTSAATGQLGYSGTSSTAQASQTSSASGTFTSAGSFTGTAAVTQANQTGAAAGQLGYSATATPAQASNTPSASGTVVNPVTGTASPTQAAQSSIANGILRYTGTTAVSQGSNTAAIQGIFFIPVTGALAEVQANQTANASGSALGAIVERPFTGNTSRPTGGTTPRPFAGVTERP